MKTAIVPIIKNKSGNSSDKSNYRPIALVTACSKLFESCLLIMLEKYLHTHDQQLGFKSQHATDMCIFNVKSVIKYYTKQNSTVFTCFLDAAKAFDRVLVFLRWISQQCTIYMRNHMTVVVTLALNITCVLNLFLLVTGHYLVK